MRPDDERLPDSFFAVPLANLEVETVLSFDLYIQHRGAGPLLYRSRNMEFTPAVKDRLIAHGVAELHVPIAQAEAYRRYREVCGSAAHDAPKVATSVFEDEEKLVEVVRDRTQPIDTRTRLLVGVSRTIVREALSDLGMPGLAQRVHRVAEESARLLLSDVDAFPTLVTLLNVDTETYSHMSNTALYATELARASGIGSVEMLTRIGRAALLHDVGKAALPHALLDRGDDLTDLEFAEYMTHTTRGVERLAAAGFDDPICLDVAQNHHEHLDGSGFPRGISGLELSPATRIVAIVDTFDLLTSRRRGSVELSGYQALWKMKREEAGAFDPELLDAFIRVMVEPVRAI